MVNTRGRRYSLPPPPPVADPPPSPRSPSPAIDDVAAAMTAMLADDESDDDIPVDLSYNLDSDSDMGAKSLMEATQTPSPIKTTVAPVAFTESATSEAVTWLTGATSPQNSTAATDDAATCIGDQKQSALTEEEREQFGSIEFLIPAFPLAFPTRL